MRLPGLGRGGLAWGCPSTTHPHCRRSLPSSLLLLSRVFTLTAPAPPGAPPKRGAAAVDEVMLRDTLCTLPDEAVEDVELFQTADR